VREYNYLVESNFKTKHQVADYAEMLNKSPKYLILFKKNTTKKISYKLAFLLRLTERYQRNRLRNRLRRHPVFQPIFQENRGVSPSDFKKTVYLFFLGANPAIHFIFYAEPQHKRMFAYLGDSSE
jgi:hypothetical protein